MSSQYYKLWVRNAANNAWIQLSKFTGLKMGGGINAAHSFSCTVFETATATQAVLTPGRKFRITTSASTDGTVATFHHGVSSGEGGSGFEVMTGRLNEPGINQKTVIGGNPLIYNLSGTDFYADVAALEFSNNTFFSTETGAAIINTATGNILTSLTGGSLTAGTLDTGPTLSLKPRTKNVLPTLQDIASIGDTTDDFPYYIIIDHNSSFIPRVNYYSPTNAIFETSDPFSGTPDTGRILVDETELRNFEKYEERGRVRNAITVSWSGGSTAESSDSTFPERRALHIQAHWLHDATSATTLRDTVLNTLKGTANGLVRVVCELRNAGLYAGDFDAVMGDQVGIEKDGSEVFQGKFLAWEYSQSMESLRVHLGLPKGF